MLETSSNTSTPQTDRPQSSPSQPRSLQTHVRNLLRSAPGQAASPAPSTRRSPRIRRPPFFITKSDRDRRDRSSPVPRAEVQRPERHSISTTAPTRPVARPLQTPDPDTQADAMLSEVHIAERGNDLESQRTTRQHSSTQHTTRRRRREWRRKRVDRPKCFGCINDDRIRRKAILSFVVGFFLILVLIIYLAIALSQHRVGQEFHVLFILLILSISIIFCHALVRICILVLNPLSDDEDGPNRPHRIPSMTGIEGYRPERPFQVHLVADVDNHISSLTTAELVGRESSERQQDSSKVVAAPPPAYGLWRNSVRVNPALLYWERVNNEPVGRSSMVRSGSVQRSNSHNNDRRPITACSDNRPPSYLSDEGVDSILQPTLRHSTMISINTAAPIVHQTIASRLSTVSASSFEPSAPPPSSFYPSPLASPGPNHHLRAEVPPPTPASLIRPSTATTMQSIESSWSEVASDQHWVAGTHSLEATPPIIQSPYFGSSLEEEMLLHPVYRTGPIR